MSDTFKTRVLDPVRDHIGHKLSAPRRAGVTWGYDETAEAREIQLTIEADQLCGTLKADGPSSPVFALCLAAALDGIEGPPARASVEVTGAMPSLPGLGYRPSKQLLQFRRSSLVLDTLSELLPERFHLTMDDDARWSWPAKPWYSVESYRKNKGRPDSGPQRLAYEIELGPSFYASFGPAMEPIRRFQSQMPLIVHDGEIGRESTYTLAGQSGIDVWVASADDRRLHLFSLDAGKRSPVGSLADAIANISILEHAGSGNGFFDAKAVGLAAARKARRMVMWLTAKHYHPLIFDEKTGDSTVLRWLNRVYRRREMQWGVLPWGGEVTAPEFRYDARWGGGFR